MTLLEEHRQLIEQANLLYELGLAAHRAGNTEAVIKATNAHSAVAERVKAVAAVMREEMA